jgi:hypothetical protein
MSRRPEVLDLSATDMPKALRLLDDAFAQLGDEPGLELVADEGLEMFHEHLESTHPDQYEWWPLESPGGRPRALVARRSEKAAPVRLMAYFCADHRGMRGRLSAARAAVEAGDRQEAAKALHGLENSLVEHWRAEEELLFPLLIAADPMHGTEAVARLRQEHQDFANRLGEMGNILAGEERFDQPRLANALGEFWKATVDHEAREEAAVHAIREYAAGHHPKAS